MIGNITQTSARRVVSMFGSFCFLVGGTNPEESCKVQFEGNLELIKPRLQGIATFLLLTLHPTSLLHLLIGNYENCNLPEEKAQENYFGEGSRSYF